MAEDEPENLVLLHLRDIRNEVAKIAEFTYGMSIELKALRERVASISTMQDADHDDIAAMKARLDRIEKRLGLID